MRVLAGPRLDLGHGCVAAAAAYALAGPGGEVVSLREVGITTLSRPLSQAEISALRDALRGGGSEIVGYVCGGRLMAGGAASGAGSAASGAAAGRTRLVAVTDHADLTWRSPLVGPNDPSAGPRFPSVTGVYSPETVVDRLGAAEGMIVVPGVVAGVRDDARPTVYEAEIAAGQGHVAVSSELTAVVIVAAHLGLRVAAALVAGT